MRNKKKLISTRQHCQNLVHFIKLILIGAVVVWTQELECSLNRLQSVFHCSADELIDYLYTIYLVIFAMTLILVFSQVHVLLHRK